MRTWLFALAWPVCVLLVGMVWAADKPAVPGKSSAAPPKIELSGAMHRLEDFEAKVKRMRGQPFKLGPLETDTLKRVWSLKERYPDDPKVEELYQKARTLVMASKGETAELPPGVLEYRDNEKKLTKSFLATAQKEWEEFKRSLLEGGGVLKRPFPAPDPDEFNLDEVKGKYVILDRFEYPTNMFTDMQRTFVYVGGGTRGYYYVDISGRAWLGAYEAVKRYRRFINRDVPEGAEWTLVGKVVGQELLVPQAGEQKTITAQWGWVVEPAAIWVPDRTFAVPRRDAELGGTFAGEARMEELKGDMYTVKEVPKDVTPEKLTEIYVTAIKEKNYSLYMECILPDDRDTPTARSRCLYHWDWHQYRFATMYCHVKVGDAKVTLLKGVDTRAENIETKFLDARQLEELKSRSSPAVYHAELTTQAFDERGNQYGSPKPRMFRKVADGRWYIANYPQPF